MDLSKLGRTEQVLTAAGLLLFVFSFFPWFSGTVTYLDSSYSGHSDAWADPSGFIDWFPILLLLVYAIVLALPAFGVVVSAPFLAKPANRAFIGLVLSAFAVLLFAIQGLTYPSVPAGFGGSVGPGWAFYLCLLIALGAGVQSYLGFTQQGGSFAQIGASFQARTATVQQQQQPPYGQQPPPYGAPGQPPQDPQQPPAPPTGL